MAEEEKKDNFWLYIGGLIAIVVVLVVILKGRETEHLQGGYEELNAEIKSQLQAEKGK